jgi:hypothetical protein
MNKKYIIIAIMYSITSPLLPTALASKIAGSGGGGPKAGGGSADGGSSTFCTNAAAGQRGAQCEETGVYAGEEETASTFAPGPKKPIGPSMGGRKSSPGTGSGAGMQTKAGGKAATKKGSFETLGGAVGGVAEEFSSSGKPYGQLGTAVGSIFDIGRKFLNAVGDLHYFDESSIPRAKDIKEINQPTTLTIRLPNINGAALYVFKPTEGNLAGKNIQVLFKSYSVRQVPPVGTPPTIAKRINDYRAAIQNSGMISVDNSVVMVFRRIVTPARPGMANMTQYGPAVPQGERAWYEIGSARLTTTNPSDLQETVIINPDATVTLPNFKNLQELDLAKPTGG